MPVTPCVHWSHLSKRERAYHNPYATHLPILVAIARLQQIRRVLEFGCGEYSTISFLNRSVFPNLVELYSFENNREWADKIRVLTSGDNRVNLIYSDRSMHLIASEVAHMDVDLILIDDSFCASDRVKTIDEVARRCNHASIVAIHDFEVYEYRRAAKSFLHNFSFTGFKPHTGIAWNDRKLDRHALRKLNRMISKQADHIGAENLNGWDLFSTTARSADCAND